MSKKNIFIILLVAVIVGFIGYWIYLQSGFSKETLRLEILGPESAKMGDEIEYTVKYKNTGNVVLENPKLNFIMPDNSLTEDGKTRIVQDLKDIYPGDEQFVKIKTRLVGKENDLKVAKASLSYTPKNLTAKYESNTTFTTKIDSVPITLDFDLPSNAEKGKDLTYAVNYFSNVDYPLENMSIKISPVSGFDFSSSSPTSLDNSEWKLPVLNKSQGGRVSITGKISADAGQALTFTVQLGMWQNGNFIVVKEANKDVQSIQPLLFISQQVNGSSDYVASPGQVLHYQIFFRNIGSTPFDNLFMVVKLDGAALDMSTLQPNNGGQSQSNDNMIVWDSKQADPLRHLDPQQEGSVSFDIKTKSDWNPNSTDPNNALIADQINISQITQKFTIKVNSGLVISQQAYRTNSSGDIPDSGPIPPKVGSPTTYTITWDIKNYFSDAKNVKVKAVLPPNVAITGKFSPSDESANFSFDSASRQIVWSVGDVLAGTGVKGDPVSLSFQVSLTPKSSQKGAAASLIGPATVTGENQFTNTTISSIDGGKDTSLQPGFWPDSSSGIVQ